MKALSALSKLRDAQRRIYPFNQLQTIEDHDIVCAIGAHQESGRPFSCNDLANSGIGSAATVRRRVDRLERLGIVQKQVGEDSRVRLLTLSKTAIKDAGKLSRLLAA